MYKVILWNSSLSALPSLSTKKKRQKIYIFFLTEAKLITIVLSVWVFLNMPDSIHNRFSVYICQSYQSIIKNLVLVVYHGIYYYYLYYYHLNYQISVHQVPHIYRPTHAQLSSAKITEIQSTRQNCR